MKTVAIIGATGEVGYRLVDALTPSYKIVAVLRDPEKRDFRRYSNVEVRHVEDISDIRQLSKSIENCDAIINAGYIWFAEQIHQALLRNKVSACHIIFTGSTGIFTQVSSISAERKRSAEKFIYENFRCNWTIIRPTMIYGHKDDRNISRLIIALARYPVFLLIGNGGGLVQPVLICDLVKAYEKILFSPKHYNKSYNIAGAKAYTNLELVSCAASVLGKRVRIIPVPAALVRASVTLLSKFGISPISKEQVERFQEDKDIDVSEFVEDFGYLPDDLKHGLQLLVRDLRDKNIIK